jgi:hypothetical protein
MLPGPLCACACSLRKNKKKISVAKLQHSSRFGGEVRRAPVRLLCVSACELNFFIVY